MAKVFETRFRSGSLYERYSGNVFTLGAAAKFSRTKKGLVLDLPRVNGIAYTTLPAVFNDIAANDFSISFYCKIDTTDPDWSVTLFEANLTSTSFVMLWCSGHKFEAVVCDAPATYFAKVATSDYQHNKWYHIIITWLAAANTVSLYIDNVLNPTVAIGTNGSGTHNLTLGCRTTYGWQVSADCVFGDMSIYDHILTEDERTKLYDDYRYYYPVVKEKYPKQLPEFKSTDLSRYQDKGLLLAYNCIKSSGNLLVDISGNEMPGGVYGARSTLNGLFFDGVNDYIAANITADPAATVKTIAFRIKLATTTEMILEGNTNAQLILANAGTLEATDYDNIYINGIEDDTVYAGRWMNVVVTSSTPVDNATLSIGYNSTTFVYGKFELEDFQVWSTQWSLQDVKDYHNSFIRPGLVVDFSDEGADGVAKVPSGFTRHSGSFCVGELTAQDSVLKHLEKGSHFMKCLTAGAIAIPSRQSYGTWEFDICKYADVNITYIKFINNIINTGTLGNGYTLLLSGGEELVLLRAATPIFATDVSYIEVDTWYRIKITRDLAGIFTIFIKGGAFGSDSWTLVVPTGAYTNPTAADNTYTKSEYLIFDFDAGDSITNIQFKGEIGFGEGTDNILNDWFLPSINEWTEIYNEVKTYGLGSFVSHVSYWTSSEQNNIGAFSISIDTGTFSGYQKGELKYVRACRMFNAPAGTYSLRDIGPSGGLIFYIDDTIYFELAPSDQSLNYAWSNIINILIGTTSIDIGEGQNNTNEIIAQAGHTDSAAKLCDDLIIVV